MGGSKAFVNKLQMVFDNGLLRPCNEPDIAYPHLFSYFKGEEWRTQKEIKRLLNTYFKNAPDGIPGNDDTGTMSAWAVFNMIGFYPDCPGEPAYTLTTPVFDKVTIKLSKEQWGTDELVITSKRSNKEAYRINNITVGGKPFKSYRISHKDLIKARNIHFDVQ